MKNKKIIFGLFLLIFGIIITSCATYYEYFDMDKSDHNVKTYTYLPQEIMTIEFDHADIVLYGEKHGVDYVDLNDFVLERIRLTIPNVNEVLLQDFRSSRPVADGNARYSIDFIPIIVD